MMIVVMLGWWYSRGWLWVIQNISTQLKRISKVFAVKMLLKTWFAPWKQIYSPSTFRTFFTSLVDNTVSRFIGTVVRSMILLCAFIISIFTILFGLISVVVWPILPLGIIVLPILAIIGVDL